MHEVGTTSCRQNAAVTGKALPGELGDVHPQATAYPLLQFLGVGCHPVLPFAAGMLSFYLPKFLAFGYWSVGKVTIPRD
jgi:hypothetical protein